MWNQYGNLANMNVAPGSEAKQTSTLVGILSLLETPERFLWIRQRQRSGEWMKYQFLHPFKRGCKAKGKEESGVGWMERKRGKENLISCWNKLSFITLMGKRRERVEVGKKVRRKPLLFFFSFRWRFQIALVQWLQHTYCRV